MDSVIVRSILLSLLVVFATAAQSVSSPSSAQVSSKAARLPWLKSNGPCSVDVCFAVDGSDAVSQAAFLAQRSFIDRLSRLLGAAGNSKAGAVQFGLTLTPVSPVTSSRRTFRARLHHMRKPGGKRAFVAAGLAYCARQLQGRRAFLPLSTRRKIQGRGRGSRRKVIVLIQNGKRIFGSGRSRGPLRLFQGKVFAVAVGSVDRAELEKITGDPSQVFVVQNAGVLNTFVGVIARKICQLS